MKMYTVSGDMIVLAKQGNFDAVVHGCNCFNRMGAGLAPQMVKAFGCHKMMLEKEEYCGDYNKMGQIEFHSTKFTGRTIKTLKAINAYTQYRPGPDLCYTALEACFKKLNHYFKGMVIGMPKIGCGIAGGNWNKVRHMIIRCMPDVAAVVIVNYDQRIDSKVYLTLNDL